MKIALTLRPNAYTPEAYAYMDFLSSKGHEVILVETSDSYGYFDVGIFFMGIKFGLNRRLNDIEIHEYQSLSLPPFSKIKDYAKKNLNIKPDGRIFLNNVVHNGLGFADSVPYIYRDMGVDDRLFLPKPNKPIYDLIYCGSINGRPGLVDEILRLAGLGLKLVIVGDVDNLTKQIFKDFYNITITGKLARHELPEVYQMARAGLNFTPDIFPFNIQTSTKTLEYLAAGLGLVSNRYCWSVKFVNDYGVKCLWLDEIHSADSFQRAIFVNPDMTQFKWANVLDRSGIENFLTDLLC